MTDAFAGAPHPDPYGRLGASPPVRPISLTDLAYQKIRHTLLSGEFAPGDTLSIVKLADALKMSRSPVRAAAERISVEGLLELRGSGLVVRVMSRSDLLDALEVRAPLEALSCSLSCRRLSHVDLEKLREIQRNFAEAVDRDDTNRARETDLRFHELIQSRSGNETLVQHLERLQAQVIITTYASAWGASQHRAVAEHASILSRLIERDADGAADAAFRHIESARQRVAEQWDSAQV